MDLKKIKKIWEHMPKKEKIIIISLILAIITYGVLNYFLPENMFFPF